MRGNPESRSRRSCNPARPSPSRQRDDRAPRRDAPSPRPGSRLQPRTDIRGEGRVRGNPQSRSRRSCNPARPSPSRQRDDRAPRRDAPSPRPGSCLQPRTDIRGEGRVRGNPESRSRRSCNPARPSPSRQRDDRAPRRDAPSPRPGSCLQPRTNIRGEGRVRGNPESRSRRSCNPARPSPSRQRDDRAPRRDAPSPRPGSCLQPRTNIRGEGRVRGNTESRSRRSCKPARPSPTRWRMIFDHGQTSGIGLESIP